MQVSYKICVQYWKAEQFKIYICTEQYIKTVTYFLHICLPVFFVSPVDVRLSNYLLHSPYKCNISKSLTSHFGIKDLPFLTLRARCVYPSYKSDSMHTNEYLLIRRSCIEYISSTRAIIKVNTYMQHIQIHKSYILSVNAEWCTKIK
jgi:hypothetical protein